MGNTQNNRNSLCLTEKDQTSIYLYPCFSTNITVTSNGQNLITFDHLYETRNRKVFGQNPNYKLASSISPSNNLYSIAYNLGISHIKLAFFTLNASMHLSVHWTLLYISRRYFVGFYFTPRFPTSNIGIQKKVTSAS